MTTENTRKELAKRLFFYAGVFFMLFFCVGRMVHAYVNNIGIDFTLFFQLYLCGYARTGFF